MEPLDAQTPMTGLITVDDTDFARLVLRSRLPVAALFGAPDCAASQAMRAGMETLAGRYAGRLTLAALSPEAAPLLAEQCAIPAMPTLAVFRYGEERARAVGFLPIGLLELLCQQAADETLPRERLWSPTEAVFEDTVVIPLIRSWGLSYRRQVHCAPGGRGRPGFVDLLLEEKSGRAISLFENKRLLRTPRDLQPAVNQAARYARALELPSFVVADPSAMRVYDWIGPHARCLAVLSSLDVAQHSQALLHLLRGLA
ncbi:MAG TPA: thioredoxin family protein [Roseiflexaceae bacterium]|nr:thioredoxin family protein [Roseiflexaceae bacterium]